MEPKNDTADSAHALPQSTVWPAALALGSTLLVWGLISSLVLSAVGAVLFAVALAGWIREIRHERARQGSHH